MGHCGSETHANLGSEISEQRAVSSGTVTLSSTELWRRHNAHMICTDCNWPALYCLASDTIAISKLVLISAVLQVHIRAAHATPGSDSEAQSDQGAVGMQWAVLSSVHT